MELNKKDFFKYFFKDTLAFIISAIIGYAFYWFVSMRIIDSLYYIDSDLKGYFLLFCHILCFYLFIKVIFKMDVYDFEKKIVGVSYFVLMMMMFFDRVHVWQRMFNINPFDVLNTIQETGIASIVLNVIVFSPFYTIVKWNSIKIGSLSPFKMFLILSIGIEVIQYITMCGIFDIVDIVLYLVGYFIGVGIYKFLFI